MIIRRNFFTTFAALPPRYMIVQLFCSRLRPKIRWVLPGCFLMVSLTCFSQTTTHEDAYWTRYYLQLSFSHKFILHQEIDNRRIFNPDRQLQFISTTQLHYKALTWLEPGIGISYSRVTRSADLVQPEIRTFEEVSLEKKLPRRLSVSTRLRLENRFFHKLTDDRTALDNGYDFVLRYRFRVSVSKVIYKKENHQLIVKVSDEYMFQSGKIITRSFDQNRLYGAAEFQPNQHLGLELGYMYYTQGRGTVDLLQRDVIRFTLYHRVALKKKVAS